MKVAIFGRDNTKENFKCFEALTQVLNDNKIEFTTYKPFLDVIGIKSEQANLTSFSTHKGMMSANVLVSIGGDGTFLRTIGLIRNSEIPVLGINTGRLGYLAGTTFSEINETIQQILNGEYTLDKRKLVSIANPKTLFNTNYALNEFTVNKKDISSMIIIHTYLDDEYLNSYWADGLIISTPTGSTGYSLSCGGPIILPESNSLVLTPIAPHNLTARPIVIPDHKIIKLKIEARENKIMVTLDGRCKSIANNTEFIIKKEDFTINLIKLNHQSHLSTLRNKLMWGIDKRN